MFDATILLPNFNNQNVLPITFDYLRRNLDCSRLHFVMVDDGSEDNGVAVAKTELARCHFASAEIIERKHEGIVPALNTGLQAIKTEFVVRIDGDATVETPGWVSLLLDALRCAEVGMVGGQVIWEYGRVHSFGRNVFSEQGLYDLGCCPLEPAGQRTFDSIVYCPPRTFPGGLPYEVDTVLGVCVAFRRSEALAVGGFDMSFNPVWIEDDDFGVALRKLGKRVIINPEIRVVHRPSLRGSRKPGETQRAASQKSPGLFARPGLIRRAVKHGKATLRTLLGRRNPEPCMEQFIRVENDSWRAGVLRSHYAQWKIKWGFDPINPNMGDIFERYWDTSFCRQSNPDQFRQSREFLGKLAKGL
jgi:GT2 family glycosyltransferase